MIRILITNSETITKKHYIKKKIYPKFIFLEVLFFKIETVAMSV